MDNALLHRKELIVLAAIELLDECGYQGLSTKEVARRLGISEATIFKHFRVKNDLLLAMLDRYSQYDADLMASAALKGLEPIMALHFFIGSFVAYCENYPAITTFMQLDEIWRYDPVLAERAANVHRTRSAFVKRMIEAAQQRGEIREDADSGYLTVTLMGLLREWCLQWRLSSHAFPLRERVMDSLRMVLKAFSPNDEK